MQTDLISRSAVLTVGNIRKVTEYDEAGYDMTYDAVPVEAIEALPAVDAVPVVHEKDIRSSVITVKDSDEWQDRIILTDESTQVCAVYYADDSERVPVVHAKWIEDGYRGIPCVCSHCGEEAHYTSTFREQFDYDWEENLVPCGYEEIREYIRSNFCPNCGARMDGDENAAD